MKVTVKTKRKCNHAGCDKTFPIEKYIGQHISYIDSAMTRKGWQQDIYAKFYCPKCSKKHLC